LREVTTAKEKTILKNELYDQYNWFYQTIFPSMQVACNEFFSDFFSLDLVSVSKNINVLFQGDDYFVTKIRIDKQHDVFFRISGDAIKIILDKTLGENKEFDLTIISELEAKIISSFNDYLYNNISRFLIPPQTTNVGGAQDKHKKRKNFDVTHLTFFIKAKQADIGAKLILSIPQVLLAPKSMKCEKPAFDAMDFKKSKLDVNINVGTTKFPLQEIKNLEKEDIVVFENSNIHTMKLIYKNYKKDFKINQNLGLIASKNNDNDNGGNNMDENSLSQNLWDNIQVEMSAEFEKVKITLGELKNIEQGLVVDISSVYDNRISLLVENKTIAKGELVIINDRYGVRIDEIFSAEKQQEEKQTPPAKLPGGHEPVKVEKEQSPPVEEIENANEEFDYSDFELDDQDI
jgi:flagellar motor switch/type III secretory pathway protein FliN